MTEKGTIEVHTSRARRAVEAELYGAFAVHESVGLGNRIRGKWSVTQITTGHCLLLTNDKDRAIWVARRCDKEWPKEIRETADADVVERWARTSAGKTALLRCRIIPREKSDP